MAGSFIRVTGKESADFAAASAFSFSGSWRLLSECCESCAPLLRLWGFCQAGQPPAGIKDCSIESPVTGLWQASLPYAGHKPWGE